MAPGPSSAPDIRGPSNTMQHDGIPHVTFQLADGSDPVPLRDHTPPSDRGQHDATLGSPQTDSNVLVMPYLGPSEPDYALSETATDLVNVPNPLNLPDFRLRITVEQLQELRKPAQNVVRHCTRLQQLRQETLLLRDETSYINSSQTFAGTHLLEASRDLVDHTTRERRVEGGVSYVAQLEGHLKKLRLDQHDFQRAAEDLGRNQDDLSVKEQSMQQREDLLITAAQELLNLIRNLAVVDPQEFADHGVSSTEPPVDSAPPSPQLPDVLKVYYEELGNVGVYRERLEDIDFEYSETVAARGLREDQGAPSEPTTLTWEAENRVEREQAARDLERAKRALNNARRACIAIGIDPANDIEHFALAKSSDDTLAGDESSKFWIHPDARDVAPSKPSTARSSGSDVDVPTLDQPPPPAIKKAKAKKTKRRKKKRDNTKMQVSEWVKGTDMGPVSQYEEALFTSEELLLQLQSPPVTRGRLQRNWKSAENLTTAALATSNEDLDSIRLDLDLHQVDQVIRPKSAVRQSFEGLAHHDWLPSLHRTLSHTDMGQSSFSSHRHVRPLSGTTVVDVHTGVESWDRPAQTAQPSVIASLTREKLAQYRFVEPLPSAAQRALGQSSLQQPASANFLRIDASNDRVNDQEQPQAENGYYQQPGIPQLLAPKYNKLTSESIRSAHEHSDSRYKFRKGDFFTVGRVFLMLYAEPVGLPNLVMAAVTRDSKYREGFNIKPRQFIVVRAGQDSCTAIATSTYDGHGVARTGVIKSHHAVVYSSRHPPSDIVTMNEQPSPGEEPMKAQMVRVTMDDRQESLNPMTRVNLSKVYTINHFTRVHSIGMVHHDSVHDLAEMFWLTQMNDPVGKSTTAASLFRSAQQRINTAR